MPLNLRRKSCLLSVGIFLYKKSKMSDFIYQGGTAISEDNFKNHIGLYAN